MEPGVIMATQNFKRNLLLTLYREGGKKNLALVVCFLLPLKREVKKSLTLAAYVLSLGTLAFLPVTPQKEARKQGRKGGYNPCGLAHTDTDFWR